MPQSTAASVVGAFGALLYLSTIPGAGIADRLLGMERTVLYGCVVVLGGLVVLIVLPGLAGVGIGLVLVALGAGALNANASSLLGTQYEKGDARADAGFRWLYLSLNLGAFLGPIVIGLVQARAGFRYGGWTAPASWIDSVAPIWVIVLSPLFAVMWTRLGTRAPTTPRKFAYGVAGMGVAFLLFTPPATTTGRAVPALVVVVIMALFAIAELILAPTGLAVTTKLAPVAYRTQTMALYSLSIGLGTSMSGLVAGLYAPEHELAQFGITGAVVLAAGVIVLLAGPRISRLMAGVH